MILKLSSTTVMGCEAYVLSVGDQVTVLLIVLWVVALFIMEGYTNCQLSISENKDVMPSLQLCTRFNVKESIFTEERVGGTLGG